MPLINRNININLSQHLYDECQVLAKYALTSGKQVPVSVIQSIDTFSKVASGEHLPEQLEELAIAHETLVKIVAPARPETILLLAQSSGNHFFSRFFGPVCLIRHLTAVAIFFLVMFFILTLTLNRTQNYQLNDMIQLLYYLSAAGLGAAFAALFKVNRYIVNVTFNPNFSFSYWIRFTLGLIAGLTLVILIPIETTSFVLAPALIALLGGFSSDVLYRILTRLITMLEAIFDSSASISIARSP